MDALSGSMRGGQEGAAGCWQLAALFPQTQICILSSGWNPKRLGCLQILCALMAWLKGCLFLFLWEGRLAKALLRAAEILYAGRQRRQGCTCSHTSDTGRAILLWPAVFCPRSAVDKQYGQMRILIRWCFSLKRHHVHEEPVRAAFLMSALRVEY